MKPVHLRDAQYRNRALHFIKIPDDQLTDEIPNVTCKTCLKMLERHKPPVLSLEEGGLDAEGNVYVHVVNRRLIKKEEGSDNKNRS